MHWRRKGGALGAKAPPPEGQLDYFFLTIDILGSELWQARECRRPGSALKRLKTYPQSTMGQQRLDGLVLSGLNISDRLN